MNTVELRKEGLFLNGEKFLMLGGDFHYFRTLPSGCVDHAIDVEKGGKVICNFNNVPADTDLIQLFENEAKGLNVRKGGDATLSYASEA